jgi:hypothetical protein
MCVVTQTTFEACNPIDGVVLVRGCRLWKRTYMYLTYLGFVHGRAAVGIALAYGMCGKYDRSGSRDQTPRRKCTINMESQSARLSRAI